MRGAGCAFAILLLVSGCLDQSEPDDDPVPSGTLDSEVFQVVPGGQGFEPSIGITPDGVLYTYAQEPDKHVVIYSSTDEGSTWARADATRIREPYNIDPFLHVDRQTGRIFHAPLYGPCVWLQWSDDDGQSWETNPRGGCGTPLFHFQKLTTGPRAAGVMTEGYPNVVYLSAMSLREADPTRLIDLIDGGTPAQVTRSLDGGLSFSAAVEVHPLEEGCYTQPAGVVVASDGTAYSMQGRCNGIRVSRSDDSGATWTPVAMLEDVGWLAYGRMPSAVVHADGAVTLLYHGRDGHAYVRDSADRGETWSTPLRLGNDSVRTTMFTMLDIDDQGNLFAAFFGTAGDVSDWERSITAFAPPDTVWHLFVAALPAGSTQWTVEQVTREEDPVQRGCLWSGGDDKRARCAEIGDFIGVAAQAGQAWVAYVDSCDACPPNQGSMGTDLRVARWGLPVAQGAT